MVASQYHRPETALTKARELIKCDKKLNALEILYDVMRLRRAKQWQKVLEELMMLFVELCVELRKNLHFRKAIYQYKNISLVEYTSSFEQVIWSYLGLIKEKTESAQRESKSLTTDVEDLDVLETPESLMLNAVSLEDAQARSSRAILTPWLKFLWDSYRLVLDLLRGNSKLEHIYHAVANDAYDFCIRYGRKAEFRKLSELLRLHTQKVQNQQQPNALNAINLRNPETQTLHFGTRLRQLDCALELEMYNEAFKTVEDIWGFILMSKKVTNTLLMTNYYSKSAELFLRCGCHLYHAVTLLNLFVLFRDHKKNITEKELSSLGSRALCAALAIPVSNFKPSTDKFLLSGEYTMVKQKTLANLLNLHHVPTRQSIIRDLIYNKIPSLVPSEFEKLFHVLEADFEPLNLWERSKPALTLIQESSDLSVYSSQIQEVIVSKTILQLSQVYHTLKLEEIFKLCPFMKPMELERCVIELIHSLELPIRIDSREQAVVFDKFADLGITQSDHGGQFMLQPNHVNAPDQLSHQLTLFAQVMQQITEMLDENQSYSAHRRELATEYQKFSRSVHMELLKRGDYIERRKEQLEAVRQEQDRHYLMEEAQRQAAHDQKLQFEEQNLQREAEERERQKTEEEQARLKRKIARGNYNLLMEHKAGFKIPLKELTEEQLDQFDADKILEKKAMEVKKKRKELAEKAKAMAKKLDHFTRAVRLEEIPLLRAAVEPESQAARELHEHSVAEIEEHSKLEHARQVKERNRLIRMKHNVQCVVSQLKAARDLRYKERLSEWEERCDAVRSERLAELKAKRDAEAAAEAEFKAKEEEERRIAAARIAEMDRVKQEQKAAEAAAREIALREEYSRSEVKKPDVFNRGPAEAPSSGKYVIPVFRAKDQSQKLPNAPERGSMQRETKAKDQSQKLPDAPERGSMQRETSGGFDSSSRRGVSDFGNRAEQMRKPVYEPPYKRGLNKEPPASVDDGSEPWLQVSDRRASDRKFRFQASADPSRKEPPAGNTNQWIRGAVIQGNQSEQPFRQPTYKR